MKIDFHIHTNYSICSNIEPSEAVKAAEKAGLDAIALINHDLKPLKFKGSDKVKVIHGVEVSTKEGHLLIINTQKEYPKGTPAQEVINNAEKDALIILPHPFDALRKGIGNKVKELTGYHAVEVNGRCLHSSFNKKARVFAEKSNKPLISGSDAHFLEEIGNAHTIVKAKTIKQAIKKIKQGKTRVFIKKRPITNKLKYFFKSMGLEAASFLRKP